MSGSGVLLTCMRARPERAPTGRLTCAGRVDEGCAVGRADEDLIVAQTIARRTFLTPHDETEVLRTVHLRARRAT